MSAVLHPLIATSPIYNLINFFIPQVKRSKEEEKKQKKDAENRDDRESVITGASQVLLGLAFFVAVRKFWWYAVLVPNGWEWNGAAREVLAGLVATVHSSLLLLPLLGCLLSHPTKFPSAPFAVSSPAWNHAARTIISFTTAYMMQDAACTLYYSFDWERNVLQVSADNKLFVAHHFVCFFYMCTTRVLNAGHYSAMQLMFLGEVTNPLQNVYAILQLAARFHPGDRIEFVRPLVAPIFASAYIFVRFALGPVVTFILMKDFIFTAKGRKNVPVVIGTIFCLMCFGIIFGSLNFGKTTAKDALTDTWPMGEKRNCGSEEEPRMEYTDYDSYTLCPQLP